MPRCSCAGSSCNCSVQAADGLAMRGTGNAADPYVISIDRSTKDLSLSQDGPLDLSTLRPGAFGVIGLAADASEVALPSDQGGQLQLLIRQDGTGNGHTVDWPADVKWPNGDAPKLSKQNGQMDWIDLRRVGNFWLGRHVATKIG